jgi:hypothetical protein
MEMRPNEHLDRVSNLKTWPMKKIFFIGVLLLVVSTSFAQNLPDFDAIKLETKADYKPADPYALQASNLLLTTPFDKNSLDRVKALRFIVRWMSGTPDYLFSLNDPIAKATNEELLGLYMACMTKYCLENPASAADEKAVNLNSIKMLISYCENPDNNIKMTSQLKKLSEADKKGTLEKELKNK